MDTDLLQMERANRVAIASSIYMRKSSLQCLKLPDSPFRKPSNNYSEKTKSPSFGKIKKNMGKQSRRQLGLNQQPMFSRTLKPYNSNAHDAIDKRSILEKYKIDLAPKKSVISSIQQDENGKIRLIEQKYSKMLIDYEKKKAAISAQLSNLNSARTHIRESHHRRMPSTGQIMPNNNNSCNLTQESHHKRQFRQNAVTGRHKRQHTFASLEKKQQAQITQRATRNSQIIKNLGDDFDFNGQDKTKTQTQKEQKNHKTTNKEKVCVRYNQFFLKLKQLILCQQRLRIVKQNIKQSQKEEIKQIILSKGYQNADSLLDIVQDQVDPFFVAQASQKCLDTSTIGEQLIENQQQCENLWNQIKKTLKTKVQIIQLFRQLNFEGFHEISLKSFVRQISFHLQKHYRNRDLFQIYQRLSPFTAKNFVQVFQQTQS